VPHAADLEQLSAFCGSMPFALSRTMTALSVAVSVRYVSSEKSW
jgi:hypothetical protein